MTNELKLIYVGKMPPEALNAMADLLLESEHPPCQQCGRTATHQHIDELRSIDEPQCDLCCDKNCSFYVTPMEE